MKSWVNNVCPDMAIRGTYRNKSQARPAQDRSGPRAISNTCARVESSCSVFGGPSVDRVSVCGKTLTIFLVFLFLSLTGCGYSLQGGGSVLPPDVTKIYIPLAQNNTAESGLSMTVTEALRDQFERFGVLYVVDKRSEADAELKAKILSVRRNTKTTTSTTDTALQMDSVLTLAADLKRISGAMLWRNNKVSVSRSFGTSSEVVVTSSADFTSGSLNASDLDSLDSREISRGQEQEVLEKLAEDAAKQIYTEAVLPDF